MPIMPRQRSPMGCSRKSRRSGKRAFGASTVISPAPAPGAGRIFCRNTPWQALVERANVKSGQKVFIHAGSGGVGTIAIQLAKHLGATIATTCSTRNIDMVKSLGADVVVDCTKQDFARELSGYDVVLNSLDAKTLRRSLDVLKPGGHLVSISGPPDPACRPAPARLRPENRVRRPELRHPQGRQEGGRALFLPLHAFRRQTTGGNHQAGRGRRYQAGDRPHLPVAQTPEALAYLERGSAKGKIVVSTGEP